MEKRCTGNRERSARDRCSRLNFVCACFEKFAQSFKRHNNFCNCILEGLGGGEVMVVKGLYKEIVSKKNKKKTVDILTK